MNSNQINNINNQINNQKEKSKRAPSKWNLFLRSCIPDQPKNLGMGEKVTACSTIYKDIKNDEKTLKEYMNRIKK